MAGSCRIPPPLPIAGRALQRHTRQAPACLPTSLHILSLSLSLPLSTSACLPTSLHILSLSLSLSPPSQRLSIRISPSLFLSYLSIYTYLQYVSVYQYICLSLYISLFLSIFLFLSLSRSVCLSVCPSFFPSFFPSLSPSPLASAKLSCEGGA